MFQIKYPASLPVSKKKDQILELIQKNQVVILTGETGSGKTTQLPKICLEAGRAKQAKIACTQPRRIAATSLAKRLADELDVVLGDEIGYKIRYEEKSSEKTLVSFMTDGIILNEIHHDPLLKKYDTIIVDEAHERSLNIDFFLGYLRQILPKRKDLKIIVTSATIDTEKFSKFFPLDHAGFFNISETSKPAPIIQVEGKVFPVEIRYTNLEEYIEEGDLNIPQLVQEAVEEILTETNDGDILVFLTGVQEIKETIQKLNFLVDDYELISLHASLSQADQNRIFRKGKKRKIICSTNIAETSITIDTVQYVIDSGNSRMSRHSYSTGTRRLLMEPVSQSSANQRKGRCGRIARGICIRLYTEEDFETRDEFTDPEILRTDLADIILKMKALDLGEIEKFSFIDVPSNAQIKAGFRTLKEIQAVDTGNKIQKIGVEISGIPLDVRSARFLIETKNEGVVSEGLITISGLSIKDPREIPPEKQQKVKEIQKIFRSENSDVEVLLNIWNAFQNHIKDKFSFNKLKKFCQQYSLSFVRMREWIFLHDQLRNTVKSLGWNLSYSNDKAIALDKIHRSFLTGFLNHIAQFEEKGKYRATKNRELYIFPGSDFKRKQYKWMIAVSMMETSRLFALRVFPIQQEWIEPVAKHLIKYQYHTPHWNKKKGRVEAFEKSMLFGLTIYERKPVNYAKFNKEEARQIFIREALIGDEAELNFPFFTKNNILLKSIEKKENKLRKKGLFLSEEKLFQFYDERLGQVSSIFELVDFLKKEKNRTCMIMHEHDLLISDYQDDELPNEIEIGDKEYHLDYIFDPQNEKDGINLKLPHHVAANVDDSLIEFQIPKLVSQKIDWVLQQIPKKQKNELQPFDVFKREIHELVFQNKTSFSGTHFSEKLLLFIVEKTFKIRGVKVLHNHKELEFPTHLKLHYQIKNKKSKDHQGLETLSEIKGGSPQNHLWESWIKDYNIENVRSWCFENLITEKEIPLQENKSTILTYTSLNVENQKIGFTLFKEKDWAYKNSVKGVAALLEQHFSHDLDSFRRKLWFMENECLKYENIAQEQKIVFLNSPFKNQNSHHEVNDGKLVQDLYASIKKYLFIRNENPIISEKSYVKHIEKIDREFNSLATISIKTVENIFDLYIQYLVKFSEVQSRLSTESKNDLKESTQSLIYQNFIKEVPFDRLVHFVRYIKGRIARLEKAIINPDKEDENTDTINIYVLEYKNLEKESLEKKNAYQYNINLEQFRWMLEEFRVSLWAQKLKTAQPISEKRLQKQIEKLQKID